MAQATDCRITMCEVACVRRKAKELVEARQKAAAEEAVQQQQKRMLAIMRHRQLFSEVCLSWGRCVSRRQGEPPVGRLDSTRFSA